MKYKRATSDSDVDKAIRRFKPPKAEHITNRKMDAFIDSAEKQIKKIINKKRK